MKREKDVFKVKPKVQGEPGSNKHFYACPHVFKIELVVGTLKFKTKTKRDQIQISADPTNSEPRKYFGALNRLGSVSSPPEATFRRIRYGTSLVPGNRGLDQTVPGQFKPSVTGCTMPWPMGILFARGCAEIPHAWTPRKEDTLLPPLIFF